MDEQDKEQLSVSAMKGMDLLLNSDPGVKASAVEKSDAKGLTVEGSEGEGSAVEDSDAEGPEAGAAYVSGPEIESEDDSSDYYAHGPYHVADVFIPIYPTAKPWKFALFPKLPVEIRRMIWRATFRPRRHVWSYEDGAGPRCKRIGLTHALVALFINKEGREEAIKCYEKLDEGPERCRGYSRRTPYVFNMNLDTLRTEQEPINYFCKNHFENLYEEIFGQVQYLEIEEWAFQPVRGQQHDFDHLPTGDLKDFKALKELTFTLIYYGFWTAEDLTGENERNFIAGYNDFFAKLAAEDPTRTTPKISIGKPSEGGKSMCKWIYELQSHSHVNC